MIFAVRGDDIFEAEHLPSYARTYILPRQMVRMLGYSLNGDNTYRFQLRKTSKKEEDANGNTAFSVPVPGT